MTRLFDKEKVKKFFDILGRLDGEIPIDTSHYPWKNYQTIYTKESEYVPCTREVFVHRTINKWLKGKYVILYKEGELGVTYKQYIYISRLSYHNNWGGGYIKVSTIDFSQPFSNSLFNEINIEHNDALYLEGEFTDGKLHNKLLEMISMNDVPDKEYIFKAYDWSKYPKRVKKGTDPLELMKTTKSFIAKTEYQAYKAKERFELQNKETKGQLIIGELIETKNISNF